MAGYFASRTPRVWRAGLQNKIFIAYRLDKQDRNKWLGGRDSAFLPVQPVTHCQLCSTRRGERSRRASPGKPCWHPKLNNLSVRCSLSDLEDRGRRSPWQSECKPRGQGRTADGPRDCGLFECSIRRRTTGRQSLCRLVYLVVYCYSAKFEAF